MVAIVRFWISKVVLWFDHVYTNMNWHDNTFFCSVGLWSGTLLGNFVNVYKLKTHIWIEIGHTNFIGRQVKH